VDVDLARPVAEHDPEPDAHEPLALLRSHGTGPPPGVSRSCCGRTVRDVHPRILPAAVALALVVGLTGCSHSTSEGLTDGCAPDRVRVSEDVARPGDAITASASAVTCRPHFTADRLLTLTWVDHAQRHTVLGTVRATPSGAFEQEVHLPKDSAIGGGDLFVIGVDSACSDGASCAADAAGLDVVDTEPDFAESAHANRVAAAVAEHMQTALEERASFVSLAIVADGVEVVLHSTSDSDRETAVAKQAFADGRASVPAGDRATAEAARLHVGFVRHGAAAMERLTMRIAHDGTWQKAHGIELSSWGPDSATDSVRIRLVAYRDTVAVLLVQRYGEAVTVSTKDTPLGSAS
jgi:hypothetical protein